MKSIKHIACFILLFSASVQAQSEQETTINTTTTLPTSIFNPSACGCDNIDIDRILQEDTDYIKSIKIDVKALTENFSKNKNRVAVDVIRRFSDNLPNVSIKQRIEEMKRTIGPKKDNAKEKWIEEFSDIASKANKAQQREVGLYIACQMALNLHTYYYNHPSEAGNAQAIQFYKNAGNNTNADNTTANNMPASPLDNVPEEARDFYRANVEKTTPWLWIISTLVFAIAAAYLFATRKKDNSDDIDGLESDLQTAREENQKLREKLAAREREFDAQSKQIAEYKDIVTLQQQKLQQAVDRLKTQTPGIHPSSVKAETKNYYLSAPQEDGSFSMQQFQSNFGQESFYTVQISAENTNIAKIDLILSPSILQRALDMPDIYLYPICEIYGEGAMPANPQYLQVKSGQLVRQGNTWYIQEKIIIDWTTEDI